MRNVAARRGCHPYRCRRSSVRLALVVKAAFEDNIELCDGHAGEEESVCLVGC